MGGVMKYRMVGLICGLVMMLMVTNETFAQRGGDPDVERLLEGFAFLTARIRERIEDAVPEVVEALERGLRSDPEVPAVGPVEGATQDPPGG